MAKPHIHAASSARKWGGNVDDYIAIHILFDTSKGIIADSRHRAMTHNSWFIMEILPRIFGETFINSAGRTVSTRDVGEQHVLEDFANRFIPSGQDYLQEMELKPWMINGKSGVPSSFEKVEAKRTTRRIDFD